MMIALDDLPEKRRRVAELRERAARAEGEAAREWAALEKDFGVKTEKEVKRLVRRRKREMDKWARIYVKRLAAFERELAAAEAAGEK